LSSINVSVLEPIATFSTEAKARAFERQLEDSDLGYMTIEIIHISGRLSNDSKNISFSVKQKIRKLLKGNE